ncbi:MAG TPA: M28 family metallopeptidase [Acidimicrobiales bacterium]|nr:M28 family metallopeptidase [Acidimicrobiales bacterium]
MVLGSLLTAVPVEAAGNGGGDHGGDHGHGGGSRCDHRVNDTTRELLECVTLRGVRDHQKALQRIADRNGGNRFSGSPGHDQSVDYVVRTLRNAGYRPTVQQFDYLAFAVEGPSTLEQTAPTPTTYVEETDFTLLDQTDPGDVTALVTPVDLQLGLGNTSTSGCEPEDFAGFPAGHIALVQRGACTFEIKAANAAAAGAVAMVSFNQGNTPERTGIDKITLGATNASGIPVVLATYALGVEWASTPGLQLHVITDVVREIKPTYNVLAETRRGNDDNVVMVGAHLDSVSAGPGINDNGSGSAAILETAVQMARVQPRNTVRFAWWGAEESGDVGSHFYVDNLTQAQRDQIALYLNFDMIGSPNYVRFVYDGDGSAFELPGPAGSAAIEALFEGFYGDRGLASEPTEIDFRSDYAPFFDADIPFGGLFTGAEGIKTPEEVAIYGGTAGEQYDPCYHAACDTFANNDDGVLALNSDAVALATLTYAKSTRTVNGGSGGSGGTTP